MAVLTLLLVACPDTPEEPTPPAPAPDVGGADEGPTPDTAAACTIAADCDDGDACNGAEACDAVQGCVQGAPLTCDDGDACNGAESCDPAQGCVAGAPPECDDGDACNGAEACEPASGCVAGEALACDDDNACNGEESCDPVLGCQAGEPLVCDDGNACNGQELCDPGAGCAGGEPLVCDDEDACNGVETCDPATGCVDGEALECDDGQPCNGVETCDAADGCVSGAPPEGCCTADADCDDQDACTGAEFCDIDAQQCQAGEPLACDDGDVCNGAETCDAVAGCQTGEALACDDANPCNGVETCAAVGGCQAGAPLVCDDDKPCNGVETCEAGVGCAQGSPPAGCCSSDADCDDETVCTGSETCETATGTCILGQALECGDDNACNGVEACDPTDGCAAPAPVECSDDNLCNGVETCEPATGCVDGAPLTCDDADVCNGLETCDAALGCQDGEALVCDDADACNGGETCDATAGCQVGTALVCDDGDACNGLEGCAAATGCTDGAPPVCDDGNACTGVEGCDAATGCTAGTPMDCDDANACTTDVCDFFLNPVSGCHHPIVQEQPTATVTGIEKGAVTSDPVTLQVAVGDTPAQAVLINLNGFPYAAGTPITEEGDYELQVSLTACNGQSVLVVHPFRIDDSAPELTFSLDPPPNAAGWHNTPVTVTWEATDDSTIAVLSEPITVSTPGEGVEVTGAAVDEVGNFIEATVHLNLDFKPPTVTLDEPVPNMPENDQLVVSADSILIKGTFGDDELSGFARGLVTSSKVKAEVEFLSPGGYEAEIPLKPGVNTIVVSAQDVAGNTATASICIIVDVQKPLVQIQFPPDGYKTVEEAIDVGGVANDLIVGSVTGEDLMVTVNGVEATVDNAQFVAVGVPLELGENVITATATDAVGQSTSHSITVVRLDASVKHLQIVSGNNQSGAILATLTAPVVVRLVDASGVAIPGHDVVFGITDNDGTIDHDDATLKSPKARAIVMVTDDDGLAEAWVTLGSRAGAALNRVTVSAEGAVSSVSFYASGTAVEALNLHAHHGLNQIGSLGKPLPMPLSVVVTDVGGNPVSGQPVTFSVVEGDGKFGGGTEVTVTSNANGFADVVFTPGQISGHSAHSVRAAIPVPGDGTSGTEDGVTFRASAFAAADPATTSVRGTILDENENPIPGVTIRFPAVPEEEAPETFTNNLGQFEYYGAPAGFAVMEIEGATAVPEGADYELPHMVFELNNVAGIANEIDRPIYLLRLNEGKWVDGLEDVTVGLDELPGFELTVRAGTTVTFPDGANEGVVSVTQVHFDQAPMAPIDGLQSRVLVTIQPPGVKFDPPAPLQIPNVDGYPPNKKVEMFSYDHDLESFVSIGTGTVSEDGSVIRSDPGVGVVKGGWHCGSNPQGSGGSAGISASLSTGNIQAKEITLLASGGPGKDTHWSWSVVCGDISASGPSCKDQSSCQGKATTSKDAARGVVKVTHICDETGESAEAELVVTLCAAPSTNLESSFTFFTKEFKQITGVVADALSYINCDIPQPKIEIKGSSQLREVCCPGCPGTLAKEAEYTVQGSAEITAECATPAGFKFPGKTFDFKFGLFGMASLKGNFLLGTTMTQCCPDPPCFCWQGELAAALTVGLKLYVISAEIAGFSIIDVHGAATTGVGGTLRVSCKQWCGALCFSGVQISGNISFLNGAIAITKRYFLACPRPLLGKCQNFEIPPGSPKGGGCANATDPCGDPSNEPGQGGQPGGTQPACGAAPQGGPASDAAISECKDDKPSCQSSTNCDNGNPCDGVELCDPGIASNNGCVTKPNSEPDCDDGIPCTEDSCEDYTGCVHKPQHSACPDDGVDCTDDLCKEGSGCVNEPNDSNCDDGVSCTKDACTTGGCSNTPQDSECSDGVDCTDDTCDATADCQHEPDDNKCNDGVQCTDDSCDASAGCQQEPDDQKCDDSVDCTDDSCDADAGCKNEPDDNKCDDGVACTSDQCLAGQGCQNEPQDSECDDGLDCTDDSCHATNDCQHQADDAKCDDSDKCDGDETCSTSAGCEEGQPLECDDNKPCNGVETCDAAQGCQPGDPPPNCCETAADCDDGDPCNGVESCNNNQCQPGTPLVCDDGNACNGVETCQHGVGCKSGSALACNDGNACNGTETCSPATGCVGGAPLSCLDADPCNGTEYCQPSSGCQSGVPLVCDDNDPCNGTETCQAGVGCQPGTALTCDDGDPCNGTEQCAAGIGCQGGAALQCDDQNACNGVETCSEGVGCQAGDALECVDEDVCNGTETCDPNSGCLPGTPLVCDDGDVCNGMETCDSTAGCQDGAPLPDCCESDVECDNIDVCDGAETCDVASGSCLPGVALTCDDGDACTADDCDPGAGCTTAPIDGCCTDCECTHCGELFCDGPTLARFVVSPQAGECVQEDLTGCPDGTVGPAYCANEFQIGEAGCAEGSCAETLTDCPAGQTCFNPVGKPAFCGECCSTEDCPLGGAAQCAADRVVTYTCAESLCVEALVDDCPAAGKACDATSATCVEVVP